MKPKTLVAPVVVTVATAVTGGVLAATAGDPDVAAQDAAGVFRFYNQVRTSMTQPPAVRLAASQAQASDPVIVASQGMDRPNDQLYPVEVEVSRRDEHQLNPSTVRACARWTTTYNTGPQSVTDTCWDLTMAEGSVVAAQPYGTDEILAEES